MHKTARLVILLEPDLLKKIRRTAEESARSVSDLVRHSLLRYLQERSSVRRGKKIMRIGRYQMPLKGVDGPERLIKIAEESYHRG